jgi:hypothetical protein
LGEIKSAIELAMERTKNLVMGEEEKREFARRNLEERLRAIVRRFLEGIISEEDFLDEYKSSQGAQSSKAGLLVDMVADDFQTSSDNERLFDLLEIVGEDAGGGLVADARSLRTWFVAELKTRTDDIRKRIMARLHDLGISGDAVEPHIPAWEESQEATREIGGLMRGRLQGWKERLEKELENQSSAPI